MESNPQAILYAKKNNKDAEVILSNIGELPVGISFIILKRGATEEDKNMVVNALEFFKGR